MQLEVQLEVGFRADLIVESVVIVELKSIEALAAVHKKILLTYLRLADKRLGLLINFGTEQVDAVNDLIGRVGIRSSLGPFLVQHLTQVLRRQHGDVIIRSIEFGTADLPLVYPFHSFHTCQNKDYSSILE